MSTTDMSTTDLAALAEECLKQAREDAHGRSAHMFLHSGALRQAVIALVAGAALDEHNAPPAAALQVLAGRVAVTAAGGELEVAAGRVCPIPQERHGLRALADSVVLLTTVTGVD